MDSTDINILSLCSGVAGLELGLHTATNRRTKVVGYVEWESFSVACLLARMEEQALGAAPIWCGDLREFNAAPFRGLVDGIVAGYPCSPYSSAGKRRGAEDPRYVFSDICQIIEEVQPVFCFFENVTSHFSKGFQDVYESLGNLGYSVEAGIYSAQEVGLPHRRNRLFILCCQSRQNLKELQIEYQTSLANTISQGLEIRNKVFQNTKDFIPEPPSPDSASWRIFPRWLYPAIPQSYFCREVDGIPSRLVNPLRFRVDRLRALGNAVVPAVAAHAFLDLLSKLLKE